MAKSIACLIVDDEPVAREILEHHLSFVPAMKLVGSCKSALEAFKYINTKNIDLIFLDINMPEISGLSFAQSINKNIKIIFTTAYRQYAVDGFDLQAVDYLLKPISFERFMQAVNKYLDENIALEMPVVVDDEQDLQEYIFVRSDRKMIKVTFSDIRYIESLSDYIKIHLKDKTVLTRETISNIEARLPQANFLRIHRSFIVSLVHIDSYTNETMEIHGKELPISRSYKTEVLQKLDVSK